VRPLILNVAVPNPSFLKDYRKNLLLKFGKDMQLQFKRKNQVAQESEENLGDELEENPAPRTVALHFTK
jgi:hypothetical protein